MGRKSNLGGLAALAGLAYMMTRDKAKKGEAPTATAAPAPEVKVAEPITAPKYKDAMQEKEPGWDTKEAPAKSAPARSTRSAAPSALSGPSLAADAPAAAPAADDSAFGMGKTKHSGGLGTTTRTLGADNGGRRIHPEYPEDMRAALKRDAQATARDLVRGQKGYSERTGRDLVRGQDGYAKGGSVKGWGIARGARKAKTY